MGKKVNMTKNEMKSSIEARWRIHQIKTHLIIALAIILISMIIVVIKFILKLDNLKPMILSIASISGFILSLPAIVFAIYSYIQYRLLFRDLEKLVKCEVVLNNPHTSYNYRSAIYYTVQIIIDDKNISCDTKPFFSSNFFSEFQLDDYNNKKVTVAYNPITNKIITIG